MIRSRGSPDALQSMTRPESRIAMARSVISRCSMPLSHVAIRNAPIWPSETDPSVAPAMNERISSVESAWRSRLRRMISCGCMRAPRSMAGTARPAYPAPPRPTAPTRPRTTGTGRMHPPRADRRTGPQTTGQVRPGPSAPRMAGRGGRCRRKTLPRLSLPGSGPPSLQRRAARCPGRSSLACRDGDAHHRGRPLLETGDDGSEEPGMRHGRWLVVALLTVLATALAGCQTATVLQDGRVLLVTPAGGALYDPVDRVDHRHGSAGGGAGRRDRHAAR